MLIKEDAIPDACKLNNKEVIEEAIRNIIRGATLFGTWI